MDAKSQTKLIKKLEKELKLNQLERIYWSKVFHENRIADYKGFTFLYLNSKSIIYYEWNLKIFNEITQSTNRNVYNRIKNIIEKNLQSIEYKELKKRIDIKKSVKHKIKTSQAIDNKQVKQLENIEKIKPVEKETSQNITIPKVNLKSEKDIIENPPLPTEKSNICNLKIYNTNLNNLHKEQNQCQVDVNYSENKRKIINKMNVDYFSLYLKNRYVMSKIENLIKLNGLSNQQFKTCWTLYQRCLKLPNANENIKLLELICKLYKTNKANIKQTIEYVESYNTHHYYQNKQNKLKGKLETDKPIKNKIGFVYSVLNSQKWEMIMKSSTKKQEQAIEQNIEKSKSYKQESNFPVFEKKQVETVSQELPKVEYSDSNMSNEQKMETLKMLEKLFNKGLINNEFYNKRLKEISLACIGNNADIENIIENKDKKPVFNPKLDKEEHYKQVEKNKIKNKLQAQFLQHKITKQEFDELINKL